MLSLFERSSDLNLQRRYELYAVGCGRGRQDHGVQRPYRRRHEVKHPTLFSLSMLTCLFFTHHHLPSSSCSFPSSPAFQLLCFSLTSPSLLLHHLHSLSLPLCLFTVTGTFFFQGGQEAGSKLPCTHCPAPVFLYGFFLAYRYLQTNASLCLEPATPRPRSGIFDRDVVCKHLQDTNRISMPFSKWIVISSHYSLLLTLCALIHSFTHQQQKNLQLISYSGSSPTAMRLVRARTTHRAVFLIFELTAR